MFRKPAARQRPVVCRFLDAGGTKALRTLSKPASKKRQGTKSREAGRPVGSQRYGDFRLATHPVEAKD
jgi:hypothetical protein